MKKLLPFLVILFFSFHSFSQKKEIKSSGLDPYTLVTKVLKFTTINSFYGTSKVGNSNGESVFDFSKWSKQFPNVIVSYTAFGRSAREGGVLRNFRFKNNGNYNTKIILADWQNFDKNSGSGTFELSLLNENYPNKLYIGIQGSGWSYFFNIELNSLQYQELINSLKYETKQKELDFKNTANNLLSDLDVQNNFETWSISKYQIKYKKGTKLDWGEVYDIANKSKGNVFNVWRLPSIEELKEIYPFRHSLGITSGIFWSSTIHPPDRMGFFSCIEFSNGDDGILSNEGQLYYLLVKTSN